MLFDIDGMANETISGEAPAQAAACVRAFTFKSSDDPQLRAQPWRLASTLAAHAEVLQHRSGRTGRAGKKGTAILLVPYPRRRRVEGMLRSAQIAAEWIEPPTAETIRRADSERLLEKLLAPAEVHDEDRELAAMLLEKRTPEDIAAALVQMHRAAMPEPEELVSSDAPRPSGPRPGFEGSTWFRLNCGRNQNADARWVLPLLCRRGHVTRSEIGAIRIAANETLFEVTQAVGPRFLEAVGRTAGDEDDGVEITKVDGPPREAARENRRERSHDGPPPRRHDAAPRRNDAPPRQHATAPRHRDAAPAARTYVAKPHTERPHTERASPPAEQPAQPRKALTARPHEPKPAGHKPGGPKYGGPKRGGPKPGGPRAKWKGKPERSR